MRTLHLERVGEGLVAEGVAFTNGRVVLQWLSEPASIELYATVSDLRAVREASGRSRIIFADEAVSA